jgi:hypothetical protein
MRRIGGVGLLLLVAGCTSGDDGVPGIGGLDASVPGVDGGSAHDAGSTADATTHADAGADADTDANADADADADANAGADTGADAGADAGTDAGVDAGVDAAMDAGTDAATDASLDAADAADACVPTTCVPANPCDLGTTDCVDGGCVDTGKPAPDGTTCGASASCTRGACSPDVSLLGTVDLSTTSLVSGRACADGFAASVTALTATTATLAAAPAAGCLAPGDEVLLVNLQGTATSTTNLGVYENLRVASVNGASVQLASPKTRSYGDGANDDTDIGTGTGNQKVALVRIPTYGKVEVSSGATLTADPWNGLTGGVVALRGYTVTVDGTIAAAGLGYRAGMWSKDGPGCSNSLQTTAGESIAGVGGATSAANAGASGGMGPGSANFNTNTPLGGSAGHATAGQAGSNAQDRTLGQPGGTYGVGDGSRLTMGSGGGGNVTCDANVSTPILIQQVTESGGIVAIFGGAITVSATGLVDARSIADRSAASAGYVLLRGDAIDVGTGVVLATGATSMNNPPTPTNQGGDGFVALLYGTSVTGTTSPPAYTKQVTP